MFGKAAVNCTRSFVRPVAAGARIGLRTAPTRTLTNAAASGLASESEQNVGGETRPGCGPDTLCAADSLTTWRRDDAVRLRLADQGPAAETSSSVVSFFKQRVERAPNNPALKTKIAGNWTTYTFENYYDEVTRVARAFIRLGLEPMNAVGILGFNAPQWHITSMATITAGGLSTGLYTTNSAEACHYIAHDAQCNIIVVDSDRQLHKILEIRHRLPHLRAIVQYQGKPEHPDVLSWSELLELGSQSAEAELDERIRNIAPNKCCALVYTSGTTGDPKGVMLSHDNLVWTARRGAERSRVLDVNGSALSYLPLSHIAAQLSDIYITLDGGFPLYFAQPDALQGSLVNTLKEVQPTFILGVPRVWEKMHQAVVEAGKSSGSLKRQLVGWARKVGTKSTLAAMSGGKKAFTYSLADKLVLSKIRQALGLGQCKLYVSSAAPISRATLDFFASIGAPVVEVYGLSEATGPHTYGDPLDGVLGSTGRELDGAETFIFKPDENGIGEMYISGRNVCMGYLNRENATREAFDETGRYFRTGDLGRHDNNGLVYVSGRKKEILVTSGGKNIPSVLIEDKIKNRLPCVSNCMLVGDGRKYVTALLTLKTEVNGETQQPTSSLTHDVISWCRDVGADVSSVDEASRDAAVADAVQRAIDDVNEAASCSAQRVQKWTLLPTDFCIAGGELGPTLKLRRHCVLQKYQQTIDDMYADDADAAASPAVAQTSSDSAPNDSACSKEYAAT